MERRVDQPNRKLQWLTDEGPSPNKGQEKIHIVSNQPPKSRGQFANK